MLMMLLLVALEAGVSSVSKKGNSHSKGDVVGVQVSSKARSPSPPPPVQRRKRGPGGCDLCLGSLSVTCPCVWHAVPVCRKNVSCFQRHHSSIG